MKIGFLQFSPVLGDIQANTEKVARLLESIEEVAILVLPELSN